MIGIQVRLALCVAALLVAWPAMSEPVQIGDIVTGYVYYNRPDASLADHNSELAACMREVGGDQVPQARPEAVGLNGPVGGLILHAIWDGPLAGIVAVKIENCMIVRAWRVGRLSDDEGAQLGALPTTDLVARLTPLIGARTPHGEVVRWFGNEADRPADFKLASRPAHPGASRLSLRVYETRSSGSKDPTADAPPGATGPVTMDPHWPTKALKAAEIASAPSDAGVILVRIRGIGPKGGGGIVFARQGPRADVGPSMSDHAPDVVVASLGWLYAKRGRRG